MVRVGVRKGTPIQEVAAEPVFVMARLCAQPSLEFFGKQKRLAGAQNGVGSEVAAAEGLRRGAGIVLVDPELKMNQIALRIMQGDEAVLRIENFPDGAVGEVKKIAEIAGRNHPLDDFGDDPAFRLRRAFSP